MTTFSFQNFNRNKIPSPLGYNTMLDYPLENQNYITNFSSPKKSSKTSIDNSKQITPALSEKNKYNDSPYRNCLTQELMKQLEESSPVTKEKNQFNESNFPNISSFEKSHPKFENSSLKSNISSNIFQNEKTKLDEWNYQLNYINYSLNKILPKSSQNISIIFHSDNSYGKNIENSINPNKKIVINSSQLKRKPKTKNTIEEREGDWNCYKCKNLNFAFRKKCNRCQASKKETEKYFEIRAQNILKMLGYCSDV